MSDNFFKLNLPVIDGNSIFDISDLDKFWQAVINKRELKDKIYRPEFLNGEDGRKLLSNINFKNVSFSKTEISGMTFQSCNFENCLFIGTKFKDLIFRSCSFSSCNMHQCSFENTYIDPSSFDHCLDKKKYPNIGAHLYQRLMKNFDSDDNPKFLIESEYLFKKWTRLDELSKIKHGGEKLNFKQKIFSWPNYFGLRLGLFLKWVGYELSLGYGRKAGRFFVTTIIMILLFWAINYNMWEQFNLGNSCDNCQIKSWDLSLYYTIISLSNLGYGDVVPYTTWGRVAASVQAMMGAIWFAIMASMIFKRISR